MGTIKDYFGLNLKHLRMERKLTQEKLSELIEINQRQLTRIETGKSYPSFQTLERLCEELNIEPYELFDFGHIKSRNNSEETSDDLMLKIQKLKFSSKKYNFIKLALSALENDRDAMLKMQSILEGMLLLEK